MMNHDFNKPPFTMSRAEIQHKQKLPVYILMLVGFFLLALLLYMFAGMRP